MASSGAIVLCLCLISNFTNAFVFPDSITSSNSGAIRGTTAGVETTAQISSRANTATDEIEEATEYSASANACQQYSKLISGDERNVWNDTNSFPWMAAIGYLNGDFQIFYACNGIVISEAFILTSAACVSWNFEVVFARLGISSQKEAFYVKEIIRHPYYDPITKKNDIALIRFQASIIWSKSIRPACLQTNVHDEDPSTMLYETGWVRHSLPDEPMLREDLRTKPLLECNQTILEYNRIRHLRSFRHGIGRNQFCAYDPNDVGQSCRILSGGALQTFPTNSLLPKIVGITSFRLGDGCSSNLPGIFTRVANYIPWIESIVWPFDRRKVSPVVSTRPENINTAIGSIEGSSLISAVKNGQEEIVSLLIQNGANVNQMIDGETALHAVANAGHEGIARMLVHNGADYTIKNGQGKTPSALAAEKGLNQLARVLQENIAQKACDVYSNIPVVTTRLLGGDEVESDHEFPWMAALGYVDSNLKINFNCAGTLISDKFILTAAHCVKASNPPVLVRLGQLNLNNNDFSEKIAENHHIREIFRHPDYSLLHKINDIALIELENRVYFSESTRPACLQTYLSDENPNLDLAVAGWGIVSPTYRNRSDTLLKTTLKTLPLAECSTTMRNFAQKKRWTPFRNGTLQSHYCASDPNHVSDTCEGDSGGALQIIRKYFDLSTVVGVVSTGPTCGTSLPGIYTRVAYFIDWIESYVWPNGGIATPKINQAALYN